jgi:hypothetical protein
MFKSADAKDQHAKELEIKREEEEEEEEEGEKELTLVNQNELSVKLNLNDLDTWCQDFGDMSPIRYDDYGLDELDDYCLDDN